MRVNKWGIGAALLATVMLAGCSATIGASVGTSTASAQASAPAAASDDCPKLKMGATIDGKTLRTCMAERMSTIAGYAGIQHSLGEISKFRYNPADQSYAKEWSTGSVVIIDGVAYAKSASSAWQKADPASSDPGIAEISPATADLSVLDFVGGTEMLDTTFTVTATGTRLDKPVFILTGQVQNQGFSSESTYEIAADYAMLAEKSASDLDGQPIEATMDVTEWDVKQDIVAPL